MRLSVIANPVAGGGRAYRRIERHFSEWKNSAWEIDFKTTQSRNHAGTLALELLSNPPDILMVCGGDGTLNEVVSQIPEAPFPVAIIPAGTANVVAKELGIPRDPVKALHVGLKRSIRKIDLGKLGPGARRRFLFVTGIGFDAYVAATVNERLKSAIGVGAYAVSIARSLQAYSFPEFQVTAGDRAYTATSCLVCNSRRYGGELLFCPDADMCDGLLDVIVLEGRRRLALAFFLIMARLQNPMRREWIHRFQSAEIRIDGPSSVYVQSDGEVIGSLPLEIGLTPSSFSLVAR
jgi:YegS/Rv2252/BmrU family lipid kinase